MCSATLLLGYNKSGALFFCTPLKTPQKGFRINYTRIKLKHRYVIEALLKDDYSINEIADITGFNKSSISRELQINSDLYGYSAEVADEKANLRSDWKYYFKLRNLIEKYPEFTDIFINKYDKKSFGIKATYTYIKFNYTFKIPSLKTVFNWINSSAWEITKQERLRKFYKKGGKRSRSAVEALVGSRWVRPFWTRPQYINDRSQYGHWEIDFIIGRSGKDNYNLITFTERLTRYGFIIKYCGKNPWNVGGVIWDTIKKYRLNVKSITCDNGFEFSKLFYLGYRLHIFIYRADPYASFQKGGNENFNGLVRRHLPKRTNFNNIPEEKILEIQNKINTMPREILDWQTADELFFNWNYYKDKWIPIPQEEKYFIRSKLKRPSNKSKNKFFKDKY
ncbi:IS30 family transposase [Mycoplasma sp. 654]|uniref:IS30 family transposase n=1 Tax=Mycoplasma sp. 654 TaxID=3398773 RepID=UPI003A8BCA2C